ncbi:MAG: hypothetical protein JEZ05_10405 [Tenericutes bacterium]|nr:hypothetical protein [Mycoplasmatota bacterium]MBI9031706.1 hypothetical protein [bacterium]
MGETGSRSNLAKREIKNTLIVNSEKVKKGTSPGNKVKSTKLNPEQAEKLKCIADARMCTESEAIRWLLDTVWEHKGDELTERANQIRNLKY